MKKKIEEKYQQLSEVEHVLLRPGMWVGSVKEEEKQSFVYNSDENKMTIKNVTCRNYKLI